MNTSENEYGNWDAEPPYWELHIPYSDNWELNFPGKCDLCGVSKTLLEVIPGVHFGWRVGYICSDCKIQNAEN